MSIRRNATEIYNKKVSYIQKLQRMIKGNSKYIIRLDDACETMNKKKWQKIESILDKLNIKPVVAVIPLNDDSDLKIDKKNIYFWDLIKKWQAKGWDVALHGYKHKYHKINIKNQIIPIHQRSEFVGLNLKSQENKIKKGLEIFQLNKIKTNVWIAPSHSFDKNTLLALKNNSDIKLISDGISLYPFVNYGFTFIPQQLWKPKKYPLGVWTVCLHPNNMSETEINEFERTINEDFFKDKFITIQIARKYIKGFNILSEVFKLAFTLKMKIKRLIYI